MDEFTKAYIVAALWSSMDDNQNPLDDKYSIKDVAPGSLAKIELDCKKFQSKNAKNLKAYYEKIKTTDGSTPESYAGHDFWLTRNSHGCGFFDRGLGKLGDKLSVAAHAWGEKYAYVGDDGLIHFD